jgi:hypothetical protein
VPPKKTRRRAEAIMRWTESNRVARMMAKGRAGAGNAKITGGSDCDSPTEQSGPDMRSISKCFLYSAIVVVSFAGSSALAAETTSTAPSGVPPGPFASWSDEQRKTVPTQTIQCCTVSLGFGILLMDSTGRPEALQARWAVCVVNAMPSDWPHARKFRDDAKRRAEQARRLDPNFKAPELRPEE